MGGDADGARACAEELVQAWEQHERFTLYEDALLRSRHCASTGSRSG